MKLGDLYPAGLKAEVQRKSIQACSKVPGWQQQLDPIGINLHPDKGGAVQDAGYEVPRSHLPATWVNKGMRKGWCI
jgi:hypothetical protein